MKSYSEAEALNKAAAYCTLCERCISEVRTKLQAWGMLPAQQENIIKRLVQERFIDESRYCRAFVNDKLRFNHWGRIKIAAGLREKRLPKEFVQEALEAIDDDEYMTVLKDTIAIKRREYKGKDDYATGQKLMRYAASRGFEPSLIVRAINISDHEVDF